MKTLNDIYAALAADKDKLTQFNAIKTSDELVKFAASYGVTATAEEIKAFIAEKKNAELSDDELDQVAGGSDKDGDGDTTPTQVYRPGDKISASHADLV